MNSITNQVIKSIIVKIIFLQILFLYPIFSQYPAGFQSTEVTNWNMPMDIDFDKNGRMYVAERQGKILVLASNQKIELINITEEVAFYGDYGLMSVELDPDFLVNGYVYLFYTVDRHHLLYFGTPNYSSTSNEQNATIARVTRFTLDKFNNFNSLVPNSRFVLIGETKSTGIPTTSVNHIGGDMKFGSDGSLIIATGDAASGADYQNQALTDGIITQEEFNATQLWRTQVLNSHDGKLLRIDPATGDGLASNPHFEMANPRSAKSRVWALGFRNPFRMALKPNTGSDNMADGDPGTIMVGDVGQETFEEINTVDEGGLNFGWPRFEGMQSIYSTNVPYHPSIHEKPTLEYGRPGATARVLIDNVIVNVGSSQFPFTNFTGGSIILGEFYEGNNYPIDYKNALFFGEFNNDWIKTISFNSINNPIAKIDFSPDENKNLAFIYNETNQSMYLVNIIGEIKRLIYSPNTNQQPIAKFNADKYFGNSPAVINFDASISTDIENDNLTYNWDFGDNTTGEGVNIAHEFIASNSNTENFVVTLTVTDSGGLTNSTTNTISVNNSPPQIISTSLDALTTFDPNANINLNLNAEIVDNEESNATLTYDWKVSFVHNEHEHLEYFVNTASGNFTLSDVPCDINLYSYKIELSVTDSYGLSTKFKKVLFPNCNPADTEAPSKPVISIENYRKDGFVVKWTNINDNIGVKSIEVKINGETQRLLVFGNNFYNFFTDENLINKSFLVQIIVRDNAGNATNSSIIYFKTPNSYCPQLADIFLSDLVPISAINGYGPYEKDQNNGGGAANDGAPITLNGVVFSKGLGVHPNSEIVYDVSNLNRERLKVKIGLDDEISTFGTCGSVIFKIYLDNTLFYTSPSLTSNSATIDLDVDIRNIATLKLVVSNSPGYNCGNLGDWADAKLNTTCPTIDVQAPTQPQNITLGVFGSTSVAFSWNASTDNLDTSLDYKILIDGISQGTVNTNSFVLGNLASGNHDLTVQAIDNEGNTTASNTVKLYYCPTGFTFFDIVLPPISVNDGSLNNENETTVEVDVLANDDLLCTIIDPTTVSLLPSEDGMNIITESNGDIVSFEIPMQGTWVANPINGRVSFSPISGFLNSPSPINYTVKNTENIVSNTASITITYKCVGDNQTISSGNWNDPSIWSCGTVPTKYNSVIINESHTIELSGMQAKIKNITMNGILNFGENGGITLENQ